MKTRFALVFSILVVIATAAGCAAPTVQPQATAIQATQPPVAQAASNSEVVLKMVERLNAGDVDGSLEYFTDDAKAYLMGFPPTGIEVYAGKEQIRALWEDSAANHFQWEVSVASTAGDLVSIQAKTWHDFTRQIGVAPLEYIDIYEVRDGKIASYGSWLTEDALARFKPAFAAVVPPEPAAELPAAPPVSEMTVTIAGGTCTTSNPAALKAGEVKVTLNVDDTENSLYALTAFNLNEGKDILDLMISTAGMPPTWADMLLMEELGPGKSASYTFEVENGPLYVICWSQPPDLPIGNAGPIPVVP